MRIAFDARMIYRNFSGIGNYSLNLLKVLAKIDRQNEYVILTRAGFKPELPQNFVIADYDFYPLSLRTLFLLKKDLSQYKVDIFHSPFYLSPLNLNVSTIVTAHDVALLSPNHFKGRYWAIQFYARQFVEYSLHKSFKKAERILAVSRDVKNDIVRLNLAEESKIRVICSAINLPLHKESPSNCYRESTQSDKAVILTVGQTRPLKNWWNLIRAFRILRDRIGKCSLVLVSSDDRNLKSIKALITELKFEPTEVKILGYQTQEQLVNLYKSADVFVFPSLYEGFGMPPLEAMACGVPVVASNRGALPEVLGDAAYYVNPETVEDIAAGMQKVLEDKELRNTLIQRGYEQVKKYSWEKTARQVLNIYNEVYQEHKK